MWRGACLSADEAAPLLLALLVDENQSVAGAAWEQLEKHLPTDFPSPPHYNGGSVMRSVLMLAILGGAVIAVGWPSVSVAEADVGGAQTLRLRVTPSCYLALSGLAKAYMEEHPDLRIEFGGGAALIGVADKALYFEATMYEWSEKWDQAKRAYEQLLSRYPESKWVELTRRKHLKYVEAQLAEQRSKSRS
jgi:hypothetical protein